MLLDAFTAGRAEHAAGGGPEGGPGGGERWAFRRFTTRNRVVLDGREIVHDALALRAEGAADPLVTGALGCFATLFFVGTAADHPAVEALVPAVRGARPARVGSGTRTARGKRKSAGRLDGRRRSRSPASPGLVGTAWSQRRF